MIESDARVTSNCIKLALYSKQVKQTCIMYVCIDLSRHRKFFLRFLFCSRVNDNNVLSINDCKMSETKLYTKGESRQWEHQWESFFSFIEELYLIALLVSDRDIPKSSSIRWKLSSDWFPFILPSSSSSSSSLVDDSVKLIIILPQSMSSLFSRFTPMKIICK